MRLEELIEGLGISWSDASLVRSVRVTDVTEDSRTVMPGSLFVARRGTVVDGASFVRQAVSAGASAVLVDCGAAVEGLPAEVALLRSDDVSRAGALIAERFAGSPSSRLKVVGVTGTNGKTTVAQSVWRLLNAGGLRCGLIGTVLTDDGSDRAASILTTPSACEVSHTLSTMVDSGCSAASLEASSHALDQGRVCAVDFDVAVFTNLSGDHLDYHGTMESYASAKARLFEMLGPDGVAVVNADDGSSVRMVRDCRARVVRCTMRADGLRGDGDVAIAEVLSQDLDGMRVVFRGGWGVFEATVSMIGVHNAMNVLQAVAAGHALGVPADALARGVSLVEAPAGRLESVEVVGCGLPRVFVDFAHTDDALSHALRALREVMPEGGRIWVVFGCGGERDASKRPRMGLVAERLADEVVLTNDNPRTEEPNRIIGEILSGMSEHGRGSAVVHADRSRAVSHAIGSASRDDVVLIAGKGHECEQIVSDGRGGTVRVAYEDASAARAALESRRSLQRGSGADSGADSGVEAGSAGGVR